MKINLPIEEVKAELVYIFLDYVLAFLHEEAIEAIWARCFVSRHSHHYLIYVFLQERHLNLLQVVLVNQILQVEMHGCVSVLIPQPGV
jgi:hypothetical protein